MSTAEGQKQKTNSGDRYVFVCQNHSCLGQNSQEVLKTFQAQTENWVGLYIEPSGCLGQFSTNPTIRVTPDTIWYYRVQPNNVPSIVTQYLKGNKPLDDLLKPKIYPRFY